MQEQRIRFIEGIWPVDIKQESKTVRISCLGHCLQNPRTVAKLFKRARVFVTDSRMSTKEAVRCLADFATMYILDCQRDDVVPSDVAYREYVQSNDRLWESNEAFSIALLDSEIEIEESIERSVRRQIVDAVPEHHQYIADLFVAHFKSQPILSAARHPAWCAFDLYSCCMLRFIDRFLARVNQAGISSADTLNSTGRSYRRAIECALADDSRPVRLESMDAALEAFKCDQIWDSYVLNGTQRFQSRLTEPD